MFFRNSDAPTPTASKIINLPSSSIDKYNQISNNIIFNNEEEFEKDYVKPFIQSWDLIKKKCVQYKCRILREHEKQQYLDMNVNLPLCFY